MYHLFTVRNTIAISKVFGVTVEDRFEFTEE